MNKQLVHIKGTKEGLVLRLDDQCAYSELVEELERKVSEDSIDGKIDVQIHLGTRYCTLEQKKQLIQIVQHQGNMLVSKVQSDVLTVEESNHRLLENRSDTYVGIVRSGQVVRTTGDILILGDVNPNGRVEAGGNIYVVGKLKGIVHAGAQGKTDAIISASHFEPTHVLIADCIEVMTNEQKFILDHTEQLFAYLDQNGKIMYDRVQEVRNIRPSLMTFKGGS